MEVILMNPANFHIDTKKCIQCQKCIYVCPGQVLALNSDGFIKMENFEQFGWNGCWKCEHCLSVCPTGAISIFGHIPENSLAQIDKNQTTLVLNSLIANRHSCRRFLDKNVDPELIDDMIQRLANAPNGSNKQQVEFTLISDKEQMNSFRALAYKRMDKLASKGIYPKGFDQESFEDMKRWEKKVRPDMLFCSAPHILIPHAPLGKGEPIQDTIIAGSYFELLCASRGLGAVIMTFPLDVFELMPEIKALLKIPQDHYIGMIIGFGYAQIKYTRGVQKQIDKDRIHILRFKEELQ